MPYACRYHFFLLNDNTQRLIIPDVWKIKNVSDKKIYIDETIHEQQGFMILAYVLCPSDPQNDLAHILTSHKAEEFHALEKMHGNDRAQKLRGEMRGYVNWNCRWGVFVLPSSLRWNLSDELPEFLSQIVGVCSYSDAVAVYMDEGIVKE